MMTENARHACPIGVYDSGVGGLSVLRAIREQLPGENLIYVADTAHVPYGEKSRHAIVARAQAITRYFFSRGAKAIAIPCNTATAAAIAVLRESYPLFPFIGIEPAVKPAAKLTHSGVIGVFATTGTLNSPRFRALTQREAPMSRVLLRPCPEWVMAVERGTISGAPAAELVDPPVAELMAEGADVLVLGCTHFPFLIEAIRASLGRDIAILETGTAVARQLERQLQAHDLLSSAYAGSCEYVSSGDPAAFAAIATQLLNTPVAATRLPGQYC